MPALKYGSPDKPIQVSIKKNKWLAIAAFFVAVIMPIIGWFGLKDFLPATRYDIIQLEEADMVLESKILMNDIKILEDRRGYLVLEKYKNLRLQDEVRLSNPNAVVPVIYFEELAKIESKIEKIDREISILELELKKY